MAEGLRDRIHFRNRLMKLILNRAITSEQYSKLVLLSKSTIEEDFELAKQVLRMILITS